MSTHRQSAPWIAPPGPIAPGLRIGLLGGSFNPAHDGHLHASLLVLKRLELDYVWWLVSPQNPLKPTTGMVGLRGRLARAARMTRNRRIIVTAIEAELGTVYTVDTLAALMRRFPAIHFVWVMGSDNLVQISHWHRWWKIFALVPVAVVARPGTALAARFATASQRFGFALQAPGPRFALRSPPAWTVLEARRNSTSATVLRSHTELPQPYV